MNLSGESDRLGTRSYAGAATHFAGALNSHFKLGKCLALSRYASPHACDRSLFSIHVSVSESAA